jgi:multisubunit Na+/H+ antiporter MnhG subunit
MSSLPADIIIWALLFVGTVFAGLGLMGLLIFPDSRSRMFTAFRATAISLGAVAFAVVTYGYILFTTTGSNEYTGLILRTLFLVIVLAAGTWAIYGIIRERTRKEQPGSAGQPPAVSDPGTKDGD